MSLSRLEEALRDHGAAAVDLMLGDGPIPWELERRPEQVPPPGEWATWLILAGRGFGKTRVCSEWATEQAVNATCERLAIVGPTHADVRDAIIEGESGILAKSDPGFYPHFHKSQPSRLIWPNGVQAALYSAEEPDRLRNKQHAKAICDEVAAWADPQAALDQLAFTMRLGNRPQTLIATTPRPLKFLRDLIKDPSTAISRGSTYDNLPNVSKGYLERLQKYEGTRLGRQELWGEILEDVEGAIWTHEMIDALRVAVAPELSRVVVALDVSGGKEATNDDQGIVAAGLGIDEHGYLLADRTCKLSPDGWARRTIETAIDFKADAIVWESNYGGEMVENTLRQAMRNMGVTVRLIEVHASKGKHVRAEPIAAIYEQKRWHHLGAYPALEDELCLFTPDGYVGDRSPNRADALVFAASELMNRTPVLFV